MSPKNRLIEERMPADSSDASAGRSVFAGGQALPALGDDVS